MTALKSRWFERVAAGAAAALMLATATLAIAQSDKKQAEAAAEGPKAEYSKEFRKAAGPVQEAVNEKRWADVVAALPELEALPALTPDDRKAIATWRLQATQGTGDQD